MGGATSYLKIVDGYFFHVINGGWASPLLDPIMKFLSNFHQSGILIILLALIILFSDRQRGVKVIVGCAITVAIVDFSASHFLKPMFNRSRPQFVEQNVRLIVPSQGSPSFPSNHAANCFAGATYLAAAFPEWTFAFYIAAAAVGVSRVYVGVHFPFDVVGGAIWGFMIALIMAAWVLPAPLRTKSSQWTEEIHHRHRYRRKKRKA